MACKRSSNNKNNNNHNGDDKPPIVACERAIWKLAAFLGCSRAICFASRAQFDDYFC